MSSAGIRPELMTLAARGDTVWVVWPDASEESGIAVICAKGEPALGQAFGLGGGLIKLAVLSCHDRAEAERVAAAVRAMESALFGNAPAAGSA